MSLTVELSTPKGSIFRGEFSAVELKTLEGAVLVLPSGNTFISMVESSLITLRQQRVSRCFQLKNATVGLQGCRLTILAETVAEASPEKSFPSQSSSIPKDAEQA